VIWTQANYAGLASIYREMKIDGLIDLHSYWQHPRYLSGIPWKSSDWMVNNIPLSGAETGGTMAMLARSRVWNRPYTVSEYNHPFPSDYCAEMFPIFASFASFQDWDGIYQYTFMDGTGGNWDKPRRMGFFSLAGHPQQVAFVPFGAVAFRTGAFAIEAPMLKLAVPDQPEPYFAQVQDMNLGSLWQQQGVEPMVVAHTRIGLELQDQLKIEIKKEGDGQEKKASAFIDWKPGEQGSYKAVSDVAVALTGAIADGQPRDLGPLSIVIDPTENGYATFSAVALDAKRFEQSKKILISIANRAENTGMIWNDKRNSVNENWGTPPTRVEGVAGSVQFRSEHPFKASALNGAGEATEELASSDNGTLAISLDAKHQTLWYLIER